MIEVLPGNVGVRVHSTTGLVPNQKVMLIQMKGATVNTANNSSFGDTTSLNNAGNYELFTICGISGDSVFFFHTVMNSYTIAAKVQLVGVPVYYSATVTDSLKAMPWNNTTGRGGVLAISVDETLTLNAPISANASGFSGGEYRPSNGTCFNFFPATAYAYNSYSLAPQDGAAKGEGVYEFDASISGGKGAPANGGGGGNNHNNGGGGGGNLSIGGTGGGNFSATGCNVVNPGIGGRALRNHGGKKIFLGGGGGAGHVNSNIVTHGGGRGGGIIFIIANTIVGNSRKISASGQVGGNSTADAASGGGAGGSIIMNVNSYTGSLTVEANGGNGGVANDNDEDRRCYGSGGGGGGGVIYFSGSTPAITITTTAGAGGVNINSHSGCNTPLLANSGSAGSVIASYTYRRSSVPSMGCDFEVLPVRLIYFTAQYLGHKAILKWKVAEPWMIQMYLIERCDDGVNWSLIATVDGTTADTYQLFDDKPIGEKAYYRIIMISNNRVIPSPIRTISKNDQTVNIYPNPAKSEIFINGNLPPISDIKVMDLSGKLLLETRIKTGTGLGKIALPAVASGIYIIIINDQVRKVSVQQ